MLERFFPFIKLFKTYDKNKFLADFIAGTILAIILLPKSIAYASIAGLPPVYGLYAAILSPAIGALFGSSSHLSTGPAAVISFLVFSSVVPLAGGDEKLFISYAILLALIVGIIQLAMGVFKTGFMMSFISHSVIIGFVNAAALIIAVTQFKDLLGLKIDNTEIFIDTLIEIINNIKLFGFNVLKGGINIWALGIGIASIFIIFGAKKIHKFFPGGIVAVGLFSFLAWKFNLGELHHLKLVGEIPSGIPIPSLPSNINLKNIQNLLPVAIVISIIGFVEAWSVAKSITAKTKEKLDVNQELIGQGMANLLTGLFQGYPVSGSFSGTAVNYDAGGKTPISNVIASIFIIICLMFFSQYMEYLPKAVLAAIVMVAVSGLFHPKELISLYKTNRIDGAVAITTFISAFVMKLDYAIFLGIIVSLILFLYKTFTPNVVEISKDMEKNIFKDIKDGGAISFCPQMVVLRPEMSLYFANTENIIKKMTSIINSKGKKLKFVLIDGKTVNYIDATALELVETFIEDMEKRNIEVYFMNIKTNLMKVFENSHLSHLINDGNIIQAKKEAIKCIYSKVDKEICNKCKSKIFDECQK